MARILTLTNWYPPHSLGGYEIECRDVMTRLAQRGHEVEILCSNERRPGVDDAEAEVGGGFGPPVCRTLQMYWRDAAPFTPSARSQLAIERANQARLEEVLDRLAPDVVSVWHMGALSLSLLSTVARRGIPMIYAICDDWLTYGIALDPWARRWHRNAVTRALAPLAQRAFGTPTLVTDLGPTGCFCFVSAVTKERSLAASPWKYPLSDVIPAGIDRALFPAPQDAAQQAAQRQWNWELLYVGRLDARKGTDTLLKAMAHLSQATLTFLAGGSDSERDRLVELARTLGVGPRVRFGSVAHEEIAQSYLAHDCFIFPSEWAEPFGLVPIEAMACGIPVVATGVGGSAEVLTDQENCVLFAPGDDAALAAAVTKLADDPDLRSRLRQGGFASAQHFDIERTTDAFERWHVAAAEGTLHQTATTSGD
jgi:glycogen(starch) synthase